MGLANMDSIISCRGMLLIWKESVNLVSNIIKCKAYLSNKQEGKFMCWVNFSSSGFSFRLLPLPLQGLCLLPFKLEKTTIQKCLSLLICLYRYPPFPSGQAFSSHPDCKFLCPGDSEQPTRTHPANNAKRWISLYMGNTMVISMYIYIQFKKKVVDYEFYIF